LLYYIIRKQLVLYSITPFAVQKSYLLLAACLHDIAKIRTQGFNKINEPCFYGHEEITDEELSQFLSPDYPFYTSIKALILCHMLPYKVLTATDFDATLRKSSAKLLRKAGIEIEVDDDFITDLMILHKADDTGSVRRDEDLEEAKKSCKCLSRLHKSSFFKGDAP